MKECLRNIILGIAVIGLLVATFSCASANRKPETMPRKEINSILRDINWDSSADIEKLENEYPDAWIKGPIFHIISKEEKKVWKKLETIEEKIEFIRWFWERRDPDGGAFTSVNNRFRREFYRRVAWAEKRFRHEHGGRGWNSDRGMVHIILGQFDSRTFNFPTDHDYRFQMSNYLKQNNYQVESWYYATFIGEKFEFSSLTGGFHIVFVSRLGGGYELLGKAIVDPYFWGFSNKYLSMVEGILKWARETAIKDRYLEFPGPGYKVPGQKPEERESVVEGGFKFETKFVKEMTSTNHLFVLIKIPIKELVFTDINVDGKANKQINQSKGVFSELSIEIMVKDVNEKPLGQAFQDDIELGFLEKDLKDWSQDKLTCFFMIPYHNPNPEKPFMLDIHLKDSTLGKEGISRVWAYYSPTFEGSLKLDKPLFIRRRLKSLSYFGDSGKEKARAMYSMVITNCDEKIKKDEKLFGYYYFYSKTSKIQIRHEILTKENQVIPVVTDNVAIVSVGNYGEVLVPLFLDKLQEIDEGSYVFKSYIKNGVWEEEEEAEFEVVK